MCSAGRQDDGEKGVVLTDAYSVRGIRIYVSFPCRRRRSFLAYRLHIALLEK